MVTVPDAHATVSPSTGDIRRRSLVIIIPAFNEARTTTSTIKRLRGAGALNRDVTTTIIVIDDGSSDGTGERAREAGADRVIRHPTNLGLGAAVRTGLMAARKAGADVVVKIDADGQHEPADIARLIRPILDDEADLVYGDRFAGIEYRMPMVRRLGNRVFTWLMRRLTRWPLRDSQPGIFAASAVYLDGFRLPGDYNYTQQILLDAYHRGMRFTHVPVTFRERTTGQSFVSYRYPFKVGKQIFLLLVTLAPLKVFVPIGLAFMAVGLLILGMDVLEFWQTGRGNMIRRPFGVLGFGIFGLQTVFFGLLGHLVISNRH
jgi:glycosyltransferase involved in cell wall biosynthesis